MSRLFSRYCFMFVIGLPPVVAASQNDTGSACDTFPLSNTTHFSVQELFNGKDDSTEIQVGSDVRFAASCVISIKDGEQGVSYIGFSDKASFLYEALPDPERNEKTSLAKYAVRRGCPAPDGGAYMLDRGYFNAIPQRDPLTHEMIDYTIDDNVVHAAIYAKDNEETSVTFRDAQKKVVVSAQRVGTTWQIDNRGGLSPAHIGLVLTHKLNLKAACWGDYTQSPEDGIGFWPSIGIAVAATAAVTSIIAATIAITCKVCEKHRCLNRNQAVQSFEQEMQEV